MRIPLRLRLSLSFLIILLFGMGIASGFAWFAVEELYLTTQRENLIAQAQLIASTIQDTNLPVEPVGPYLQTTNITPGIHTRLLSEQGAVVVGLPVTSGNNPVQVPEAENAGYVPSEELLKRPEIQEAQDGQAATAVRQVASVEGQRVLYAAAPIVDATGGTVSIVYLATPLPRTGLPLEMILQFAGIVILAITLAGLSGTMLARRIAQPIETLDRAALAVSEGDLNQVVPTEYSDVDMVRLSKSFNEMIASLKRSKKVSNAFITDVTHELRTPLTVIKGTVETLEDGALNDLEGRDSLLSSMGRETDRLIRLVNDLLVLTRADASALQLKSRSLDLGVIVHSRCKQLRPLADDCEVRLEVSAPTATQNLCVQGDADRLAQVLDNLLDNAIRHAPKDSTIKIIIKREGDEIRCSVIDQGHGIPKQHLPYIFERFYRVDSSRNRVTGGAGLGLAIVQALVIAQKGRISVESIEGGGTEFKFWLPASRIATELPEN